MCDTCVKFGWGGQDRRGCTARGGALRAAHHLDSLSVACSHSVALGLSLHPSAFTKQSRGSLGVTQDTARLPLGTAKKLLLRDWFL